MREVDRKNGTLRSIRAKRILICGEQTSGASRSLINRGVSRPTMWYGGWALLR